jgi:hypothetical protein
MEANRVAVAGNYFQTTAFSDEYDLNNPEYATPLGIAVSSGLNMINDSFRVTLNGRPAKLFRSGTFTALNLLMMNGYNFRDIMGRAGMNLTVTVNGRRKVFYGTASDPASLMINQKEGKLSDVIHAGDFIDFIPAIPGTDATARLGDVEGVSINAEVTLNGMQASLKGFRESFDNDKDYIKLLDKAFYGGQLTIFDYLRELNDYIDFKLDFIDLEYRYSVAAARLNRYWTDAND